MYLITVIGINQDTHQWKQYYDVYDSVFGI
jgi:hypothetical protein